VDARLLALESQKATDARLSIIEANTAAIKEDRMLITADIKEIKTDIKLIAVQIGELNGTHNKTK
jgi:cell fate regulator YaaT (PSP1 superfamily)